MQDELTIETKQATEAATNDNNVVIELEHLQKSFEENKVLKDINLTLCKGENLVVLGRSGQGKSVTIQCIVGLIDYDEGSLKVFGKEIKDLSEDELKEIRLKLGFLFQSGALYDSMTVRENLAFPLTRVMKMKDEDKINQEVEDVLDAVGLKDAIDKMPGDLSGGMRKRIGLARTLILKPAIMLYDEPTTGLDPITSKEISQLIMDLRKKYQTSSIIITHDMTCAKITGDRILVLQDGKFIAEGSYEDLEKSQDENVNSFFK
ncbi:ATP-binding cassette domain-containing protein [Chitinophagaceae bacterium 26-R-25]|nr:ATP-binding cassette domain-containing protein [Chitinophagaceae bacterium 26-R-25]